ncbi:MAG: AtpZ/AtpI family protein [Acidobacteriota bacterium]|nr:AtpZ/AtpI family protein [Acidobacteriota bacterium]
MPYHKPIPDDGKRSEGSGGLFSGLQSIVQVEKIGQIAFILPSAAVIGWLGGAWLDGHFHQKWMTLTGFILGCIAGISSAVKLAISMANEPLKDPSTKSSSQSKDSNPSE